MNKPKVSIIIPVYNAEDRLGILLDQVKQQTLTDYEVILINDGSTDESQDIIDTYCEEDSRFRSVAQENRGAAMARNKGLEQANGSYISFFQYVTSLFLHSGPVFITFYVTYYILSFQILQAITSEIDKFTRFLFAITYFL